MLTLLHYKQVNLYFFKKPKLLLSQLIYVPTLGNAVKLSLVSEFYFGFHFTKIATYIIILSHMTEQNSRIGSGILNATVALNDSYTGKTALKKL